MKVRDLIAAVRDYPALRQALEESNAELDLSRMECAQLQSKINELEPLIDEYYQESCSKEYAANQERQIVETLKKAFASFYPALDSTEQLRRFYDTIAPDFDEAVSASTTPPWRSPAIPTFPASSPMRTTAVFLTMLTDTSSCST